MHGTVRIPSTLEKQIVDPPNSTCCFERKKSSPLGLWTEGSFSTKFTKCLKIKILIIFKHAFGVNI